MSSADGPDRAHSLDFGNAGEHRGRQVDTQLIEALIHVLIEKGVLTRNDALNVVQTVTQVTQGELHEGRAPVTRTHATLEMLYRLYASFELVADRPGVLQADGANVRRLRPPVHDDHPEFPDGD